MKKILFLTFLFSIIMGVGVYAVFCADYTLFVSFDPFVDGKNFAAGDPIVVVLRVSNPRAMNAHYRNLAAGKEVNKIPRVTLGKPAEAWVGSVKFTIADSEGNVVPARFYATPVKEDMITLGAENFAEGYFFIAPEESSKLGEGEYSIKAAIGDMISNALVLRLVEKEKELIGKSSIPQLLKLGRYHLVLGNFEKAEEYANKILTIDAHSLRGLNLLGDARTGLKKYKQAYDTFNTAIDEFFAQNPPPKKFSVNYRPPELFMQKRNALKKELRR